MIYAAAETCQNKYALLEVSRDEEYGDFLLFLLLLLLVCTTVAGERGCLLLWASAGLEPSSVVVGPYSLRMTDYLPSHFGVAQQQFAFAVVLVCTVPRGGLEEFARAFRTNRGGWIVTGC